MTATNSATDRELAELYREMEADRLVPLWCITDDLLPRAPRPRTVPWLWPAERLRHHAEEALRLVPVGMGGERRAISLVNPGLGGRPFATSTLWGAVQCLGPRESAPAHRHSPAAIRFVLEGEGVWTTVDGDACDMRPGDLVLTPSWTWHDHTNGSGEMMLWFDGLDLPIVEALDAVFFEPYGELTQPLDGPRNRSEELYREGSPLVPGSAGAPHDADSSPLLVYRWEDTDRALKDLLCQGAGRTATVEFCHPLTAKSALPTARCAMQRLLPQDWTLPHRKTGSSIMVIYRGRGRSMVGETCFEWGPGDMVAVPSWAVTRHQAVEPADIFLFSDAPVLKALGLWREEDVADA